MTQATKEMYFFSNAVYDLLQAAKKVNEAWEASGKLENMEFEEYPFTDSYPIVLDKLQRWSDEVNGFYSELDSEERNRHRAAKGLPSI